MTAMTRVQITRTGIGPRFPPPNSQMKLSSRIGTDLVWVIHIAVPRAMPIMASVVRNEGMPTRVVSRALIKPTSPPTRRPAMTPAAAPKVVHRNRGDERNEPRHHANREVDLPGRKHVGHAHRHDRDHRGLAEDVEEIVRLEEALIVKRRREERENQHEAEIGNVLAPVRDDRRRRAGLDNSVRHGRAPSG